MLNLIFLILQTFFLNFCSDPLESQEICHPLGNNILSKFESLNLKSIDVLRKQVDSAIMVKPSYIFNSWHKKSNMTCKFKIKGPKGKGLFAVIQSMSLRVNKTTCIDYIRVSLSFYYFA